MRVSQRESHTHTHSLLEPAFPLIHRLGPATGIQAIPPMLLGLLTSQLLLLLLLLRKDLLDIPTI